MKKIVYGFFLAACVIGVAGCSTSGKQEVSPPVSTTYPVQQPVAGTGDDSAAKLFNQNRYLDIDGNDKVIMEEDIEATLPSMVYVNDRIFEYGRKLDRWKELDSESVNLNLGQEEAVQMVQCFRGLQKVINGYSALRAKMLQAQKMSTADKISNARVYELQSSDISFLESGCARLLEGSERQSVGWSQREEGADLAQLETLIDRYAENEEYEDILQVWMKIPELQVDRIHLRTKIIYGNALVALRQQEKAAEIYHQVVEQMSASKAQATDIVSLRKMLGDLYTASGEYEKAEIQYKKISEDYLLLGRLEEWSKLQLSILDSSMEESPELIEYSSLLRNFLGFNPEIDGYTVAWQAEEFLVHYPYSPVSSNVDYIKAATVEGAERWFNQFLEEVEKLGAEKQYEKAMELLETMPSDLIDKEKQTLLSEKNQAILLAIAVERETELMVQIQELQHQWNKGMLLVKNEDYDEALRVFTDLLESEYSAKARQKIEEVSLQAAKADRRKAADLFIRFTKTTDLESKKKLLVESRKLLKDILVKYPEIEIIPKVIGNIERVEQEMTAIDPNLIFMADQEDQTVEVDNLDAAFAAPVGSTVDLQPEPGVEDTVDSVKVQP